MVFMSFNCFEHVTHWEQWIVLGSGNGSGGCERRSRVRTVDWMKNEIKKEITGEKREIVYSLNSIYFYNSGTSQNQ